MGNDLEKQYNLKQKPIRLPGSYGFLKFVDHPTDSSSSLIIIKAPHKAGIVNSQILLPIKDIKNIGYSDYTLATCRRCKPLSLVKPRSEPQMKLIIKQIIKLGSQLGRIFVCDGRLMVWCQQIRSQWLRSPQQIYLNKKTDKSKVFWAGICLVNFLNCVYENDQIKKKKQKKQQIQPFFDPKDRREYDKFFDNLQYQLSKSCFWNVVSEGMKSLILIMLTKEPNDRIDTNTIMLLPYFATQKQLRLYQMLSDQMLEWDEKQSIIVMETIQMVIHDKIIFDQLILSDYLTPVLVFLLEKKPEVIMSAIIELPDPPTQNIVGSLKKANPKNTRLFNTVLLKIQRFYKILSQQQYDAVTSRTAFCSFELPVLLQKLIRAIPYILKTIKQPNYKKQIELQLIVNVLQNKNVEKNLLLYGLKCIIKMLNQGILSNINKLFNLKYDPLKFEHQLEINLHILEVYRLMINEIQPTLLVGLMMPKLDPYLSLQQLTDQLFFNAKSCVDLMMSKIMKSKNLNEEDKILITYDTSFFDLIPLKKPPLTDIISVLKKQAIKSKNQDIAWLTQILQKQELLTDQ